MQGKTGRLMGAGVLLAGMLGLCASAAAKPAQCFTTDDGHYPCDFRGLDKAGSFRIKAPGYPTYTVELEGNGTAWGFATIGGRQVALPGPYYRARDDRACWENPDTGTRICAW